MKTHRLDKQNHHETIQDQGCKIWHPNWVRLAPNGTNLGLFKIRFSTVWLAEHSKNQPGDIDLQKGKWVALSEVRKKGRGRASNYDLLF